MIFVYRINEVYMNLRKWFERECRKLPDSNRLIIQLHMLKYFHHNFNLYSHKFGEVSCMLIRRIFDRFRKDALVHIIKIVLILSVYVGLCSENYESIGLKTDNKVFIFSLHPRSIH